MDKQKFYAVRCGLIPGIYNTWDECSKNVSGYSGAEYKSFENEYTRIKFLLYQPISAIINSTNSKVLFNRLGSHIN